MFFDISIDLKSYVCMYLIEWLLPTCDGNFTIFEQYNKRTSFDVILREQLCGFIVFLFLSRKLNNDLKFNKAKTQLILIQLKHLNLGMNDLFLEFFAQTKTTWCNGKYRNIKVWRIRWKKIAHKNWVEKLDSLWRIMQRYI